MNYECNKNGNQKESKQLNNETSTDSTLLKKDSNKKNKYFFYTIKNYKIYRKIEGKIFSILKYQKKINRHGKSIRHTKRSCDNMSRKIKSWVISDLIKFINKKLKEKQSITENIRLYIINKDASYKMKIDYNKDLLQSKVENILSYNISKKLKNIKIKEEPEYNKKIINEMKKDKKKYDDILKILDLQFSNVIKHYIGNEKIDCLRGFEDGYKNKKKLINNYIDTFEFFVKNIETYYSNNQFRIDMNNKNR